MKDRNKKRRKMSPLFIRWLDSALLPAGTMKVDLKYEAPWRTDVHGRNDGGKPVERGAAAFVAYQPTRILPCPCTSEQRWRSPRRGHAGITPTVPLK